MSTLQRMTTALSKGVKKAGVIEQRIASQSKFIDVKHGQYSMSIISNVKRVTIKPTNFESFFCFTSDSRAKVTPYKLQATIQDI